MDILLIIIKIVIALGILNVWLLRFGKPTTWRGGDAGNMKEEFQIYGLPGWLVGLVGMVKIICALLLLVGIWIPAVATPAALIIAILMLGAVVMHIKVKDALRKSLPAFTLLVLSLLVVFL